MHEGIIHTQDFFGIDIAVMVLSKRGYVGGGSGKIKRVLQKGGGTGIIAGM